MFDRHLFEYLDREHSPLSPVFPLPILNGEAPVVLMFDPTDYGLDIAYEKTPSHESSRVRTATRETTLYCIPRLVPVFVTRGGTIADAREHEDGFSVIISHRNGWLSFYSRLTHMFVRSTDRRRPRVPTRVVTGDLLGYVGPTRSGRLQPLRFELWRRNEDRDPEPVDTILHLPTWQLAHWNDAQNKSVAPPSHDVT